MPGGDGDRAVAEDALDGRGLHALCEQQGVAGVAEVVHADLPEPAAFAQQTVTLENQGDYLVWGPGTDHTWEALDDSSVFTVRCLVAARLSADSVDRSRRRRSTGRLQSMILFERVALWVGAAAAVAAVGLAIVLGGWEFASWVSAVISALSVAGGLLVRVTDSGRDGEVKQQNMAGNAEATDEPERRDVSEASSSNVTIADIRGRNQISIGPMTINNNRQTRFYLVVFVVLLVVLAGFGSYGVYEIAGGPNLSSVGPPPSPRSEPVGPLQWNLVASTPIPRSSEHGPHQEIGGVAKGYTHDEAGAVLAALNIGSRVSSAAGPEVYTKTLREQTFGDVESELDRLPREYSSSTPQEVRADEYWYSVKSGDPSGGFVEVSILARTPQSTNMGGLVRRDYALAWQGGDWKLQVPSSRLILAASPAGYTSIGGPNK